MAKSLSRGWSGLPVLGLLVICSLLADLLSPGTAYADFRSAFLDPQINRLEMREGDPGDGVLAPQNLASGRATSGESIYLASDGSRATLGFDHAAQSLWLPAPGFILQPVFFWGPTGPSPFLSGRSGSRIMTTFYRGTTEHPSGDVLYVLDERGCRYAP